MRRVRGYPYFGAWVVTRVWFNADDGTWWHALVTALEPRRLR